MTTMTTSRDLANAAPLLYRYIHQDNKPVEISLEGKNSTSAETTIDLNILFSDISIRVNNEDMKVGIKDGTLTVTVDGGTIPLSHLILCNELFIREDNEISEEHSLKRGQSREGGLEGNIDIGPLEPKAQLKSSWKRKSEDEIQTKVIKKSTLVRYAVKAKCGNHDETIRSWEFCSIDVEKPLSGLCRQEICRVSKTSNIKATPCFKCTTSSFKFTSNKRFLRFHAKQLALNMLGDLLAQEINQLTFKSYEEQ